MEREGHFISSQQDGKEKALTWERIVPHKPRGTPFDVESQDMHICSHVTDVAQAHISVTSLFQRRNAVVRGSPSCSSSSEHFMVLAKDSSPRVWAGSSGARDGVGVAAGSRGVCGGIQRCWISSWGSGCAQGPGRKMWVKHRKWRRPFSRAEPGTECDQHRRKLHVRWGVQTPFQPHRCGKVSIQPRSPRAGRGVRAPSSHWLIRGWAPGLSPAASGEPTVWPCRSHIMLITRPRKISSSSLFLRYT